MKGDASVKWVDATIQADGLDPTSIRPLASLKGGLVNAGEFSIPSRLHGLRLRLRVADRLPSAMHLRGGIVPLICSF